MSKTPQMCIADARALIRLIGECRDRGDDFEAWCAHYTEGMARLVGADFGVGSVLVYTPASVRILRVVTWGWDNGFDVQLWSQMLSACESDVHCNPHLAAYFARTGMADGTALTRRDLVTDEDWLASSYCRFAHEPLGFGHTLVSFLDLPAGKSQCLGLALMRHQREAIDFDPRQRSLLHEGQVAITALVGGALAGHAEPSPSALPPRVREVLRCILQGESDKQIAAQLELSHHTVNQYVKSIFHHFGVNSRSELLACWLRRGWGHRCGWAG